MDDKLVWAAVGAVFGFLGKMGIELYVEYLKNKKKQYANLIELQSLLRASKSTFRAQGGFISDLLQSIRESFPESSDEELSKDLLFSKYHAQFNHKQKDLHSMIRGMTVHSLFSHNQALMEWLKKDQLYKTGMKTDKDWPELAVYLNQLETYLILWNANYMAWVHDQIDHALVDLGEMKRQGISFPKELDSKVDAIVARRRGTLFYKILKSAPAT